MGRAARAGRRGARHHRAHRRDHPQPRRHDGVGARGHPAARAAATSWPRTASTWRWTRPGSPTAPRSAACSPPADAGPAALVHGSLRDLVIGVTLVLADGTVARSGGHVIKNVAGYDLAKVVHGSYGTLAVVAEVVLRLHPVPKAAVTRASCRARWPRRREAAARVLGGPVEPAALEWTSDGVLAAAARGHRRRALGARAPTGCARCSGRRRRRTAADGDPWAAARRAHPRRRRTPPCCASACGPPGCPRCSPRCPRRAATAGLGTGVATVTRARAAPSPTAHAAVHAAGGTSVLRARPPGAHLPAWGPPPSAVGGAARRQADAFDPTAASVPAASTPGCDASCPAPSTPTDRPSRELLDDCVHCGFCLPTCPTYQLWGEEMDSPRGRIYLMSLAEKGEIGLEGPFATHIDRVPRLHGVRHGVPVGRAVRPAAGGDAPAAGAQRRARPGRPAVPRRDLRAVPLQAAAARGRRAGRALPGAARDPGGPGARRAAAGPARGDGVAAAAGLGARRVRPPARCTRPPSGRAAAGSRCSPAACRTCSSTGSTRPPCGCSPPRAGTCSCPATSSAAARWSCTPAARSPRWPGPGATIGVFERPRRGLRRHQRRGLRLVDEGVRPPARRRPRVGGAGRGVQRAGARRARGARRAASPARPAHPVRARVAYHDACHLGHAQKVRAQPRAVLRSIPGRRAASTCRRPSCAAARRGSTTWSRPRRRASSARARRRTSAATRPDIVVTANPGCLLQIGKHLGMDVPLLHPVQLLDASIRGVPVPRTEL